jgi:glycosyltransferase involved in cell wall biosynthesis
VEPNNSSALAEAILKMLQDPETARSMGREGRKMVERDFTSERMCEKMYALYSSLLEKEQA